MSLTNELSNFSYTNKDFNSIYVELLEYAKQLSYKWDPTTSDESDPGVVLLKLAAIIGDKDSYNIDQNILELMPASVSQLPAARQLFDQCGYTMRYYTSGKGLLNLTLKKDIEGSSTQNNTTTDSTVRYNYRVPKFTMFTDQDRSVVYTTTEDVNLTVGYQTSVEIIEGIVNKYLVNNDSLITLQNLDSNNRLYFTESNIAENGIFVRNVASSNTSSQTTKDWTCVDNILTQPKGTPCFKFGVTIDSSLCYIEFPEDIELLIGEGIEIDYILTSGSNGNISAARLNNFYVDTNATKTSTASSESEQVKLTSEYVVVTNPLPVIDGKDPETIEEAYKNYKRVKGTFETLVSLKDYCDYLITNNKMSNGFVCDRTNDIQRVYKVLTTNSNTTYLNNIVTSKEDEELYVKEGDTYKQVRIPSMNAYDLCIYGMKYVSVASDTLQFKDSFTMNTEMSLLDDSVKSLQHEFLGFDTNKILMLKNKYAIQANIVPRKPLSYAEKLQVMHNIEVALCKALQARNVNFGEVISNDLIQETILAADDRIKTLIDYNSPKYETYAVYLDAGSPDKGIPAAFKELRIDQESDDGGYQVVDLNITDFSGSSISDYYTKNEYGAYEKVSLSAETFDSSKIYYTYDTALSDLWMKFRSEIFAKNVLAGVTPLYDDANMYTTGLNQASIKEYTGIQSIKLNTNIQFETTVDKNSLPNINIYTSTSKQLSSNERILLTTPLYEEENNFSSYVKLLYYLPNAELITADSTYKLKGEDFVVVFWKESETDTAYTYVKYGYSSNPNSPKSPADYIIPSGFNLSCPQSFTSSSRSATYNYEAIMSHFKSLPAGRHKTTSSTPASSFVDGQNYTETEFVQNCLVNEKNNEVLTGIKVLKTANLNEIHINNAENGSMYIYWILNNKNLDGKYELFTNDVNEYTLKTGEYFLYTDDEKATLYLLGEGTILTRSGQSQDSSWSGTWTVDAVDAYELNEQGINLLYDKWAKIERFKKLTKEEFNKLDDNLKKEYKCLWATEQQMLLLGSGYQLVLEKKLSKSVENPDLITSISSNPQLLTDYSIKYYDNSTQPHVVPDTDIGWTAQSILSLDTSNSSPQLLQPNQSVTLNYSGGNENINSDTLIYIQSNISLKDTSTNVNLESLHYSKQKLNMLFYEGIESDKDVIVNNITNTINYTIPKGETSKPFSKEFNFQLLPGNYLLQVITSQKTKVTVRDGDTDEDAEIGSNTWTLSTTGGNCKLLINITPSSDADINVTIPPLFKYTTETISKIKHQDKNRQPAAKSFEQSVKDMLKVLDEQNEFNYVYKPSAPIKNPLVASEFFKATHVFNKYTIGEWDTIIPDNVTVHDVIR